MPALRVEHILEKRTQHENLTIELLNLVHQPYLLLHSPVMVALEGAAQAREVATLAVPADAMSVIPEEH